MLSGIMLSCRGRNHGEAGGETFHVGVVETSDSVYVKGLVMEDDSTELAFRKSYRYADYSYDDDSESAAWGIPTDRKWVKLSVGKDINGYDIDVKLFPDDEYMDVGYARYYFRSGGQVLTLDTGYYYPWTRHVADVTFFSDVVSGSSLKLIMPFENLVQGEATEITECLFCFKDVDFDGEKELCFRAPGYNREYYNAYKIISGKIEPLTGEPYNNIVYGYCGNTVFDYSSKTITVEEDFGAAEHKSSAFVRREDPTDPHDPMRLLSGMLTHFGGDYLLRVKYADGRIVGEEYEHLRVTGVDCVRSEYSREPDGLYVLKTISYTKDGTEEIIYGEELNKEI